METPLDSLPKTEKRLTDFLKVLTILTFIGCAIGLYQSISSYFTYEKSITEVERAIEKMEDSGTGGMWLDSMQQSLGIMHIREENKTLFLIVELLCLGLCAYGAFLMRKIKSMGYYLWLAGEIIPFILSAIIIGSSLFSMFFIIFMVIPVAFIIMYSTQLKHLE